MEGIIILTPVHRADDAAQLASVTIAVTKPLALPSSGQVLRALTLALLPCPLEPATRTTTEAKDQQKQQTPLRDSVKEITGRARITLHFITILEGEHLEKSYLPTQGSPVPSPAGMRGRREPEGYLLKPAALSRSKFPCSQAFTKLSENILS